MKANLKSILEKLNSDNAKEKYSSLLSSIICIVSGLILGFLILLIIDPENAGGVLKSILTGGFADPQGAAYGLGNQLAYVAPLICVGLSVLFAYKTGMFNIGVAGQYTLGAFGALYFAIALKCPWWLCILAAMLFAAIWGAIPGLLKAYFKINEVITCIMTNWIGLYLVNDLFQNKIKISQKLGTGDRAPTVTSIFYNSKSLSLESVNTDAMLPSLNFAGSRLTIAIFIAIIAIIAIYIILQKTVLGYELKACGLNKHGAKYAGIKENRNIILSMAISGALAGLAAALLYLTNIEQFPQDTTKLSALAFNGIPIAFMASLNPIGVLFSAFFVAHIQQGAGLLVGSVFSFEMSSIFTGIIIYFFAFSPLVLSYVKKLIMRKKKNKEEGGIKE